MEIDIDQVNYEIALEKEWKKSQPKLTEAQWLAIFPEAKGVMSNQLDELKQEFADLDRKAKEKNAFIDENIRNPSTRWFWKEWVYYNEVLTMKSLKKRINELSYALSGQNNPLEATKTAFTADIIQKANNVPIEVILGGKFNRRGKFLIGKCPFHEEKTPSFFIYPNNTCWCFGCQQGGDAIDVLIKKEKITFREAVRRLANI